MSKTGFPQKSYSYRVYESANTGHFKSLTTGLILQQSHACKLHADPWLAPNLWCHRSCTSRAETGDHRETFQHTLDMHHSAQRRQTLKRSHNFYEEGGLDVISAMSNGRRLSLCIIMSGAHFKGHNGLLLHEFYIRQLHLVTAVWGHVWPRSLSGCLAHWASARLCSVSKQRHVQHVWRITLEPALWGHSFFRLLSFQSHI